MNIIRTETDPVVLCHGLFGSLSDPAMLAHFGERRILAPDLLGYGEYNFSDLSYPATIKVRQQRQST